MAVMVDHSLLSLHIKFGNVATECLLDSGATHNFVSSAWCKDHNILLAEHKKVSIRDVSLADGQRVPVIGSIRQFVDLGPMTTALTFLVLDCEVPMILGIPFLTTVNPTIDWVNRHVSVVTRHGLEDLQVVYRPKSVQCNFVSAKQFEKGLKRGQYGFYGSLEITEKGQLNFTHRTSYGNTGGATAYSGGDEPCDKQLASDTLKGLQARFSQVFQQPAFPVDRQNAPLFQHSIQLKDASLPPPRRKIYPLDSEELAALKQEIEKLLESNRIRPSASPYGAPILFAKKKDGGLRMCIDYRALNKNTVTDSYPLPRIEELLARLKGAKYFSRLDLRDGYHQIPMAVEDVPKTAFSCRYGTFEYLVMPMGLMNAPSTFQRIMNHVFFDMLDSCVVVYLDDILIFSKTKEQHLADLDKVFQRLHDHQLSVKESKCALWLSKVQFLGHIVSANGISVQPAKISVVKDWPEPRNLTELQQFLGLCNYYRRFIYSYAKIATPLTELLRGKGQFKFGSEQQEAFRILKGALVSAPVLKVFDPSLAVRVQSDVSGFAAGAVLEQEHSGLWHPVEYFSKRLNEAEAKYGASEREMLGCILALERWRPYLIGKQFQVLTDHAPNQYIRSQPKLSRRQARWLDILSEYDAEFVYKPGRVHQAPDALSRYPLVAPVLAPSDNLQLQEAVHQAQLNSSDPAFVKFKALANVPQSGFEIRNGLLVKVSGSSAIPVIPSDAVNVQAKILRELHETPLGGHLGRRKLHALVKSRFFWPRLDQSVGNFCKQCIVCQQAKVSTQAPIGLLQPLDPASYPFEQVTMDLITHLPVSEGFDSVFTIVDRFSKYVIFVPCKATCTAADLARMFFDHVVCKFGMPTKIISDRDSRFLSNFWQALMKLLQCTLGMSSGYHPQTDGQSERFHRSIEQVLRCYVSANQRNWVSVLASAAFALNSTVHVAHNKTPFAVLFGREPSLPLDLAMKGIVECNVQAASDFIASQQACFDNVRSALVKTNEAMAHSADQHRRDVTFSQGDLVYVSTAHFPLAANLSRKLAPKWVGPFLVEQVISPVAYRIGLPPEYGRFHPVFHASQLRGHVGPTPQRPSPVFPTGDTSDPEYEVEDILDRRVHRGKVQYLVKWLGYPVFESTWEPEEHLGNAQELLQQFQAQVSVISPRLPLLDLA